jgi:hypothetical protein
MISRRDFFVTTAVGAAGVAFVDGQTPPPVEIAAEAAARYDWIMKKWGTRFSDEQKAEIRRILIDNEKSLATMRAFALDNGVEPAR